MTLMISDARSATTSVQAREEHLAQHIPARRSAQRNVAAPAITDVMTSSRGGDFMANARPRRPKHANMIHKKVLLLSRASLRWTDTAESLLRGCISQQRERRRTFH